ncbi:MAG: HEAT repeat domain-containing protein [Verrucomicrobia bacterium]|nr:HEAT repeat domain-containing protein [Verrucomicrobiota bacterium]
MLWWDLKLLMSKKAATRLRAVEKLGAKQDAKFVETLAGMLNDPDKEVRTATVQALSKLKAPSVPRLIESMLDDQERTVRETVVMALGENDSPSARDALTKALMDPEKNVRRMALRALEASGWQPQNEFQRNSKLLASGQFEYAAVAGTAALELLSAELRSSDFNERRSAVEALGQMGDERVIAPLTGALQDEDNTVRRAAVEALGQTRDSRAIEAVTAALFDNHHLVRAAAAEAVGALKNPRTLDALLAGLQDPDWEVRAAVAVASGKIRDRRATEPLIAALADKDHDVRRAVAEALGHIGDPRAIEPLVVVLTDEQSSLRTVVLGALRRIHFRWETTAEAQHALPQLQAALQSGEYWVRQAASKAIDMIAKARSAQSAAGYPDGAASRQRRAAVEAMLETLGDESRELRLAAADALGRLGDTCAVESLVESRRDPDYWVCVTAARALSVLRWEPTDDFQRARQTYLLKHQLQARPGSPQPRPSHE